MKKKRVVVVGKTGGLRELLYGCLTSTAPYNQICSVTGLIGDQGSENGAIILGAEVSSLSRLLNEGLIDVCVVTEPSWHREASLICSKYEKIDCLSTGSFLLFCEQSTPDDASFSTTVPNRTSSPDVPPSPNVRMEQLLNRAPFASEPGAIRSILQGKRVLITGAGGAIGSELSRQVGAAGVESICLLGHGETSIFHIATTLSVKSTSAICDIRDRDRLDLIFTRFQPHIVLHAAAHKHVNLMENNVEEAVTTNIFGTRNVVEASQQCASVETMIMISTDKAVNPTCVMGVTKRVAERIVLSHAVLHQRRFFVVRFGNVLGSRGSVVPIFLRLIGEGKPLRVTHPDVDRFFMTIPEACQFVLLVNAMGKPGNLFVLEMGEPVKIMDLAKRLLELTGATDLIPITVTGLLPGEKLSEELFYEYEAPKPSEMAGITHSAYTSVNDSEFQMQLAQLHSAALTASDRTLDLLGALVPEYQSSFDDNKSNNAESDDPKKYSQPTWPFFAEKEIAAVGAVLRSGRVNYWTGPQGNAFEKEFGQFVGCRHAIALANGTLALELALHMFGVGGPDAEVIVPCRTFVATASAVAMRGAVPVCCDVDRESGTLTVDTIKAKISAKTRAIIAVHLGGWPCDMPAIMEFAKQHELIVIEDCAQSHGATIDGRQVGSWGHAGAFSFCQEKIMTTAGEGGLVTTNDREAWLRGWSYKDHGKNWEKVHRQDHPPGYRWLVDSFGTNWRLSEVQSAVGRLQLEKLPTWLATRRLYASMLHETFSSIDCVRVPQPASHCQHANYKFYCYVVPERLPTGWSRDRIVQELGDRGVKCFSGSCSEIYKEGAFQHKASEEALPIGKELGETSLMFMVHPTLSKKDMLSTCNVVRDFFAQISPK